MKKTIRTMLLASIALFLIIGTALADKSGKIRDGKLPDTPRNITPLTVSEPVEQNVSSTAESSNTAEQINWQVLSGGGITNCSAGNYRLGGTIGQFAVGKSTTASMAINHGFWQLFGAGGDCDCFPGDANNDDLVNVGDAVYIINFVFREGASPIPYTLCSGDAQGDCFCNVGDAVYIIGYIFREGAYPVSCEEWRVNCGPVVYK